MDDDKAGAMATTDVKIAVDDNTAPLVIVMMTGTPKTIAVMVMTTILLTMAPVNVTISWMMTMNDDDNDVEIGDDGEDFLPPPMTAMTAEMTMGTIGGGGIHNSTVDTELTINVRNFLAKIRKSKIIELL